MNVEEREEDWTGALLFFTLYSHHCVLGHRIVYMMQLHQLQNLCGNTHSNSLNVEARLTLGIVLVVHVYLCDTKQCYL